MPKIVQIKRLTLLISLTSLTAACSLAPEYERPAAPVPDSWQQQEVVGANTAAQAAQLLDWQSFVTDPALARMVQVALDNNRDLKQALLNVEAARATYGIQRSEQLPGLNLNSEGQGQRLPDDLRTPGSNNVQHQYQTNLGMAEFELDLFGRVRNLSDAALQEYLATEEAANSARISLVAEVIRTFLARNGAQQRYSLANRTLEAREESLKLIAARREFGAATDLDYQEALGLVQQVRVELERIDREVRQAGNALMLLTGITEEDSLLPAEPVAGYLIQQQLQPGMPSELLEQRPDIRAAERQLMARNARIGAARAAFFPRISLTGSYGSASAELSDLFSSGQRSWAFMPRLTLPIFDGGRNQANLDLAEVRKSMAIQAYEQSIQQAFTDVADALVANDTLQREESAQRALVGSSTEALRLSQSRYNAGVDDHLRYLEAQRNDFSAKRGLVDVQTQRQLALVGLFRSLGGGWQGGGSQTLSPSLLANTEGP
ncbi:efflux transporter outer membrane subunit [Marinobacterium mangrovicola]|uniref:Multidrug efflux system outer membrane protein n=1 Tax=Marinobacterium mangrovicola TaxID=1476959 RepID=A0A4R1GJB4_9GAMM|nr:efflux transporter outer membrane subunit [Marinobacterium mangrovicola]TCK06965.1 multidrug efflux system outer membrane protein [Marinobacterium mangrovicola]